MDVDGVFTDFTLSFTELARKLFPQNNILVKGCGSQRNWEYDDILTKKEKREVWDAVFSSGRFWLDMPRVFTPADHRSMLRLHEKHTIFYLTGRSGKDAVIQTSSWLHQYGLPNSDNVFLTGNDKGKFISDFYPVIDMMIDDSLEQIIKIRDAGICCYVRDWPYNRSLGPTSRVGSIAEYETYVDRIAAGEQITWLNGVEVDQWQNAI